MGDSFPIMPDHSTITRAFAWARAYLAAQNTMAAKMCLCRIMKSSAPADTEDGGQDAVQLAADIAMQYIMGGNVDEATQLLWFAASWARDEVDAGPNASGDETVIARNPSTPHRASEPPPEAEEVRLERTVRAKRIDLERTVGRFEDDVTRIYRPGQSRAAAGTVTTHTVLRFRPTRHGPS